LARRTQKSPKGLSSSNQIEKIRLRGDGYVGKRWQDQAQRDMLQKKWSILNSADSQRDCAADDETFDWGSGASVFAAHGLMGFLLVLDLLVSDTRGHIEEAVI